MMSPLRLQFYGCINIARRSNLVRFGVAAAAAVVGVLSVVSVELDDPPGQANDVTGDRADIPAMSTFLPEGF